MVLILKKEVIIKKIKKYKKIIEKYLKDNNIKEYELKIVSNAHTAKQAANSVGCDVGKIVKSLVFKVKDKDIPVMFITSGKNRVDLKKVSNYFNENIISVDADYVKQKTGYSIGGVSPFFHKEDIKMFIDKDLLKYSDVWTAAGHPKTLLNIKLKDLIKITNPEKIEVN